MVRLKLNLLQCYMCLLVLWPAIVHSFPSTNLAGNDRYQRDTSETIFTTGELDLVLQSNDTFLHFQICCPTGACSQGSFLFCFPTTVQQQETLHGCGDGTCAYKLEYRVNDGYSLSGGLFSSYDKCFDGKVIMNDIQLSYSDKTDHVYKTKTSPGCPLNITQPGNRLVLDIKTIPDGVTVKALNAQKYVEPTTLPPTTTLPPSTAPPTAETTNASGAANEAPKAAAASSEKETEETSDTLLYILIGVGILVFILIAGGIAFAVYWFCFKKKKSPKPAPPDTEPKAADAADTTPVKKESPVVKDKTKESKAENETKGTVRSNRASNLESEHWVSVNPQLPAAAFVSEENTKTDASKIQTEDETGQNGGKSKSKKSENKEVSTKK